MMNDRITMAAAIERYGEGPQLVKACEELAELQQAICKLFDKSQPYTPDVEIMLDQVRMILAVDPAQEARWRDRKLRRLKARLAR